MIFCLVYFLGPKIRILNGKGLNLGAEPLRTKLLLSTPTRVGTDTPDVSLS